MLIDGGCWLAAPHTLRCVSGNNYLTLTWGFEIMSQSLTLKISEDVYTSLLEVAKQTGQMPEVLAAQWLSLVSRHLNDDPLEKFIGAFKSNTSDWADNHDKYIGQSQ